MSIQDLRDVKIITAMITPFKEDGSINFDVLPELIEHLLAHHTEGILLAGTTAESPTLTHEEELELFGAVTQLNLPKKLQLLAVLQLVWLLSLITISHLKRECISTLRLLLTLLIYQSLFTIFLDA